MQHNMEESTVERPFRRSFSLPQLDKTHLSDIIIDANCSYSELNRIEKCLHQNIVPQKIQSKNAHFGEFGLTVELKQYITLKQHYYPEGGYGWVICFIAFIVQIIGSGIQLSYGIQLIIIAERYQKQKYESGKIIFYNLFKFISVNF